MGGGTSGMTREEFRRRLDQLQEVIARGLHYYAVWKNLALHDPTNVSWSLAEQNQVLGRFKGFFTPVALALLDMALMQFWKVFDTHPKAVSLTNLRRAAREDPTLIPHASVAELDTVSVQFRQSKRILRGLERKRDQYLAHVDVAPLPVDPIRNTDLDKLLEHIKAAFNFLSKAHDGQFVSWDHSLRDVDACTNVVLRTLMEEMRRRQKEHDDGMVRIGLDAVQHYEKVMGRRLDGEELWSILHSYGLTDEHMRRVKEQCGSGLEEELHGDGK